MGTTQIIWAKSVPGREKSQYKTLGRRVHLAYWRNTKRPVQLEQNEWHRLMGDSIREAEVGHSTQALKTLIMD